MKIANKGVQEVGYTGISSLSKDKLKAVKFTVGDSARLNFLSGRFNGECTGDLPNRGDGKYSHEVSANSIITTYHPGPKDRAYLEAKDREYLQDLIKSNPQQFLCEMTPKNLRGGLDLTEELHRNYQKEFMPLIAKICQTLGLSSHSALAWVPSKQPQQGGGGGGAAAPAKQAPKPVRNDTKNPQDLATIKGELNAYKAMVADLQQKLTKAEADNQRLRSLLDSKGTHQTNPTALFRK